MLSLTYFKFASSSLPVVFFHCQATDSECEEEPIKHSFVNHYMSDPSYFNSWKRQQKGLKQTLACSYEDCASGDAESYYQTVVTQHSVGGVYTPTGQPTPGSRTPVTGFSSFVWRTGARSAWTWTPLCGFGQHGYEFFDIHSINTDIMNAECRLWSELRGKMIFICQYWRLFTAPLIIRITVFVCDPPVCSLVKDGLNTQGLTESSCPWPLV